MGNRRARTTSATCARHLFPVCGWTRQNPVQSITCSDTIWLCCHVNCLGSCSETLCSFYSAFAVLLPWGSRPLLPETTARTFAMSACVCAGTYHQKQAQATTQWPHLSDSWTFLITFAQAILKITLWVTSPQWHKQTLKEVAENLQGA